MKKIPGYACPPGTYEGPGKPTCGGCAHLEPVAQGGLLTLKCGLDPADPFRKRDFFRVTSAACLLFKARSRP